MLTPTALLFPFDVAKTLQHPGPSTLEVAKVEEALRNLLEQLERPSTSSHETPNQEVILDICLDDRRYTLTYSDAPLSSSVSLSPREQQIIHLVAQGYPNKTIAKILKISPSTVATYLKRIFSKLGVCSRAEMIARVLNLYSGLRVNFQPQVP